MFVFFLSESLFYRKELWSLSDPSHVASDRRCHCTTGNVGLSVLGD